MLMGVWGMANMLGHASGSLMGGIVVDTMRLTTGSALAAYTALFVFEAAMLVFAFVLTLRLRPNATRASGEAAALLRRDGTG
jgi:predicted lipid-binding transport protein (Tim44 family)